ncbi:hypothetical protein LZ554_007697 [Drepanopeziza brunnea f. sp. 'monogermtubi']|nr:hypothetical protein LZ554_007697 [Drepanopeziza brunnea f. sp. 'monogermtubi']
MAPDPHQAPLPVHDAADAPAPSLAHRGRGQGRTKAEFDQILLEDYLHKQLLDSDAILDDHGPTSRTAQITKTLLAQKEDYYNVANTYRPYFPPSRLYGPGYAGYGNGTTDGPPRILYPHNKPRLGHRKTPKMRQKRKDIAIQAEQEECLMPVRLEIDWDKLKLRDTFTWNYHDRITDIQIFATGLAEDFGLTGPAAAPVVEQITTQLREQLNDFHPITDPPQEALMSDLPYSAYKNEELRILIKLNITIGPHTLEDKFEWDINNTLTSPEEFAQCIARDLALSGEFTTAIAHSIREQCQLFIRSLFIVGYPFDGRPVEDADLIAAFLPSPLTSVFRPQQIAKDYLPYLYETTEQELERGEIIWSREQRRQKRSINRRGGPTLPDLKDRQRTVRTMVVSSVIPGCADTVEESRLYKHVTGAGRSKRPGREGDLSESSDEEDSNPDSPALALQQGTARTRHMRGAATAAQQRMANLGRSETPEAAVHHHETRTSARRLVGRDARDESEPLTLIVKLRLGKERMRKFDRAVKAGRSATSQQPEAVQRAMSTPGPSAAARPGSMGPPPSTPNAQSQPIPPSTTPGPMGQIGRVDAPPPVGGQNPPSPPAPAWLTAGLRDLLKTYPNDRFEGVMKYTAVNKYMFLPRIRCNDCPGKLYTPGPERTVGNFEVHLRNRQHRDKRFARGWSGCIISAGRDTTVFRSRIDGWDEAKNGLS